MEDPETQLPFLFSLKYYTLLFLFAFSLPALTKKIVDYDGFLLSVSINFKKKVFNRLKMHYNVTIF